MKAEDQESVVTQRENREENGHERRALEQHAYMFGDNIVAFGPPFHVILFLIGIFRGRTQLLGHCFFHDVCTTTIYAEFEDRCTQGKGGISRREEQ